jgi:hypothetical protein
MSSTTDRIKGAANENADKAKQSIETAKRQNEDASQNASHDGWTTTDYVQAAKDAIDRATNYAHRKL